jgi:hypothetical protein
MHSTEICSVDLSSVKLDVPESETGWSGISRSSDDLGETMMTKPEDWTTPLVHYLENPSHVTDRKVQRQALKYVLLDHGLYRRCIDGLLLICLSLDQSKIAMWEFMIKYAIHISWLI